jgi:predicted dehydrogenase
VGPGYMGREYYKILSGLGIDTEVIGRSEKVNWPTEVYSGGLSAFIEAVDYTPEYAIVCTNEHNLYQNVKILIEYGVKNILVEKPAGIDIEQVERLHDLSREINLYVGYNRRFYQSVQKCKQIIDQSTCPVNITFEFTEWLHKVDFSHYTKEELSHFFLCNSSHVVDTVFYLAGKPKELNATTSGALDWHPSAAVFSGSGTTERDILFNYHANWLSSGRWKIEINVAGRRLILAPLEKLFVQEKGSLAQEEVVLDNIDIDYKCGLFKQVESFLGNGENLCTIKEHYENFKFYYKIANYKTKAETTL